MEINPFRPPTLGWLEVALDQEHVDYLWKCIEEAKKENYSVKNTLAGHITNSFEMFDEDDWFFDNVLVHCLNKHGEVFGIGVENMSMNSFWVNFQKQHEYNPPHNHGGDFSFVVWMKIPTRSAEQHKLEFLKGHKNPNASNFQFSYLDINGKQKQFPYLMNPSMEGKMLFFSADLIHSVNPFYECDEDRVSISGNLFHK
mgnify:FL=1|tara:strand:+ start:411 stop:1007 length:597 start_codon:yes stop_codon:yes gene_type:complete